MLIRNKNFLLFILFAVFILAIKFPSFFSTNKKVPDGDSYFTKGELDKAIACWENELEEKPDKKIYAKIITSYILKNDMETAKEWTCSGLTHFPNYANLIFNLALINFYQKNYTESLVLLNSILKRNDYFPDVHYLKGLIFEITGDKNKAQKEYITEININPGSQRAWRKIKELQDEKK